MCTRLSVHISSVKQPQKLQVDFFAADVWTEESEALLIQRMKEILNLVRLGSRTVEINLDIDAIDPGETHFLIRKLLHQKEFRIIHHQKLSIREIEILGYIMNGLTNQEIACKLFISYETVKSHRKHILSKTGAKNTAALINYYHQTFFEK